MIHSLHKTNKVFFKNYTTSLKNANSINYCFSVKFDECIDRDLHNCIKEKQEFYVDDP